MRTCQKSESGVTVLQAILVILILIFGITAIGITGSIEGKTSQNQPTGMISSALAITGKMLTMKDTLLGFPAVDGFSGNIPYHFVKQEPGKLGGVQTKVSLLIGDMGGIDMDRTQVSLSTRRGTMVISKAGTGYPVNSPNWTISSKSNWLPYQSADSDNILEPNEEFGILVLFPDSLSPYEPFTLTFQPAEAMPFSISSQVPAGMQSLMTLTPV
ncbi:MAG: hypothetical protein ABFC24_02385 [Methanoregulaceae archaeon]